MAWYSYDWPYRVKVTIDHTEVGLTQTGLDVEITEANLPAGFWTAVKSDGSDIVVTESDGETKLYRDLISIDTGAETLRMRVGCDVSTVADTELWVYFGYAAAAEAANQTQAYHSSILNYWTLDESPGGAGSITDRTGNNHGTPSGVSQTAGGVLGPCLEWDGGTSDEVDCGDVATDGLTELTVQCWARLDSRSGTTYRVLLRKAHADEHAAPYRVFDISMDSGNDNIKAGVGDGTQQDGTPLVAMPLSTWTLLTAVFKGSTTTLRFYKDTSLGGENTSTSTTAIGTSSEHLYLGHGKHATDQYWDGRIDEVRILDREMESGEITTRYNNESSPSTFYSCGSIEEATVLDFDLAESESGGLAFGVIEPLVFILTESESEGLDFTIDQTVQTIIEFDLAESESEGLPFAVIEPVIFVLADSESAALEFNVYNKFVVDFGLAAAESEALTFQSHQIAETSGRVSIRAVGATYEIRHVDLHHRRKGVPYTFQLEVVWVEDNDDALLWASEDWLTVSVDGDGAQAVGTSRATAAELGAGEAGDRKTLDLTLTIPADEEIRSRVIRLTVGLGT